MHGSNTATNNNGHNINMNNSKFTSSASVMAAIVASSSVQAQSTFNNLNNAANNVNINLNTPTLNPQNLTNNNLFDDVQKLQQQLQDIKEQVNIFINI